MNTAHKNLTELQILVLGIQQIKRNHRIPGTEERENVVEHSFSVAMLSWKLFDELRPKLDLEKILKYALAHDFSERGQKYDINTYADDSSRLNKKEKEAQEVKKISEDFSDFEEMVYALENYEKFNDEESKFVWSVDKIRAIILGGLDDWRPYRLHGIGYEQFYAKCHEFISKCSPCLKEVFKEVVRESLITYYDRPKGN